MMLGKAKSITHTSASVDYSRKLNEEDSRKGIVLEKNLIYGTSGKEVLSEFKIFQDLKPNCERNTISMVVSPHPLDSEKMSNKDLLIISKEVIRRMKLDDHQYLIVKHPHPTHDHAHIYANRISPNGIAYKDHFISKKVQRICDDIAKDFNLVRACEIEEANKLIQRPIKAKIYETVKSVIDKPSTNVNNLVQRVNASGIQMEAVKSETGKLRGYTFIVNKYEFKGSEISPQLTVKKLKERLGQYKGEKNQERISVKGFIRSVFERTLPTSSAPRLFLQNVQKYGINIQPVINKQGTTQGYRINYKDFAFTASQIGNKYRLSKLSETIKNAHISKSFIHLYPKPYREYTVAEKLKQNIFNTLREPETKPKNLIGQLAHKGIQVSPSYGKQPVKSEQLDPFQAIELMEKEAMSNTQQKTNSTAKSSVEFKLTGNISTKEPIGHENYILNNTDDKNGMEIFDYSIRYHGEEFNATDLLLKYTFDHPEKVLENMQNAIQVEESINTHQSLKAEVEEMFEACLFNSPESKEQLFDGLQLMDVHIVNRENNDFTIKYQDTQFLASSINERFTQGNLDQMMVNYSNALNDISMGVDKGVNDNEDFGKSNFQDNSNEDNSIPENESFFPNAINPLVITQRRGADDDYDDEEEYKLKKRKQRRKNNNPQRGM